MLNVQEGLGFAQNVDGELEGKYKDRWCLREATLQSSRPCTTVSHPSINLHCSVATVNDPPTPGGVCVGHQQNFRRKQVGLPCVPGRASGTIRVSVEKPK